ncbi:5'-methylthioadenosine/adenosylhomocysteine nucleosidase [Vibrio astriarenae]|uniref:5'-methylthioadenosine/adenosylhomocysteine nucleosidase n=1 Tax=Vibrio astriarenae TaxID=1481923 RepID=UPI003736A3FF
MKIALIGAMEQEVSILRSQLTDLKQVAFAGFAFYEGKLNGTDVVLLQSGIGKVAAAAGTALLIEGFKPDVVINTGSAGGFNSSLSMGDVVVSTEVCYHDVDVTAFGYEIGQMARQPRVFSACPELVEVAIKAQNSDTNTLCGLIASGDSFVCRKDQIAFINHHFPDLIAAEMEAAAIAQICHQFGVPFVVVRAISDVVDKESPEDFNTFLDTASQSSSAMVVSMVRIISESSYLSLNRG